MVGNHHAAEAYHGCERTQDHRQTGAFAEDNRILIFLFTVAMGYVNPIHHPYPQY